jgi:surface antigen
MNAKSVIATIFLTLFLAGCAGGPGYGHKQGIGTLGGAALGGLVGAQFGSGHGKIAAATAGVLIGAMVGGGIGGSLDEADRTQIAQANYRAAQAPVGQSITWSNPHSGNYGSVTPLGDVPPAGGVSCREFSQTVVIGGRSEESYGTACRQPDGSWRIQ